MRMVISGACEHVHLVISGASEYLIIPEAGY